MRTKWVGSWVCGESENVICKCRGEHTRKNITFGGGGSREVEKLCRMGDLYGSRFIE